MHPKGVALCELHKDAKCRMPNDMIEVCVMNSTNHVMCRGRESPEEHNE